MRTSRHPVQERIPTTPRDEDAPAEKTSAEMSSVEHFLSDYAVVDRAPIDRAPVGYTATPAAPGR